MQPGGRAGGGGGGGVRDNKMEGEKERVGEREKERRQGEQLKPLLLPPSPLLPRLPLPSALAHPDHCAPGGVQEINGRMLTTFDRLHKRGHLGSHDATCTPPPHPHLTPPHPHLTPTSPLPHPHLTPEVHPPPLHLLHHQHHHPNTGAAAGRSAEDTQGSGPDRKSLSE